MNVTQTFRSRARTAPATAAARAVIMGAFALVFAAFVFAPVSARAQDTVNNFVVGVYKCSATYTWEYSHGDSRLPPGNFQAGVCSKGSASAVYYMVLENGGNGRHLIYCDAKNKRYSIVYDCNPLCVDQFELFKPAKQTKYVMSGCRDSRATDPISLNGNNSDDAERCEIWCETGLFKSDPEMTPFFGTKTGGPNGNLWTRFPASLKGSYCRSTCYNYSNLAYREIDLGKKNYSLLGPYVFGFSGQAKVIGKTSCKLDTKLTYDAFFITGDGVDSVLNFLVSKGYVFHDSEDCTDLFLNPFLADAGQPFLP